MHRLILVALVAVAAPAAAGSTRLLSGAPSGPPVKCIFPRDVRGQTIVDRSTIIFERGGSRYWRNDLSPECAALRPDRAIVTQQFSQSQICEGEVFQVFDNLSRVAYGGCTFGKFTPYQRPAR